MRRAYAVILAMFITACSIPASQYEDVSHEQRFAKLLGAVRTTKSDMLVLGIDSLPSKKEVQYFVLVPYPGFEGPEVLSRSVLPKGTAVKIIGVESCKNCGPRTERFLLEVSDFEVEASVYLKSNFLDHLGAESNELSSSP